MPRFFVPGILSDKVTISGEDAKHMIKSLRLTINEEITLCDGKGFDYHGKISAITDTVTIDILEKVPTKSEPSAKITLFQALPKGDKMELIIQKCVELGVYKIVPVLTERCISRPDKKSMAKKVERYQKIALEAAKQSGRGIIPEVCELLTLKEAVSVLPKKSIVFYENGGDRLVNLIDENINEIGVFVGSEGGFSMEEIEFLKGNGVSPATLGERILRCETAPICGVSVILSLTGDI